MKNKSIILTLLAVITAFTSQASNTRYVGGDISLLPTMEKAGSNYMDNKGKQISDLITYSYEQGMNAMRVRIFVDPDKFLAEHTDLGAWYYDACQSYDYILPICKRIQASGHKLLLDFHYSDTWADPSYQYTPASWASLSGTELYQKIYEYTKEVLTNLKNDGVVPEFIQTGNEISYGMCYMPYGGTNSQKMSVTSDNSRLTRFQNLLENAIKACREVCPQSKIVLHTERVANTSYTTAYYDWAKNKNIDYDIIGLSYYFYYHGRTSQLENTLKAIENNKYGKEIWIVETGGYINWVMGDTDKQYYEPTDEGQNQFTKDLLAVLDNHPSVTGVFWWEMEYNAKGTSLSGWYNASLFDNNTGKATSAFYTLASWASGEPNIDPGEDDDNAETFSNLYFLYNNNGAANWSVPGVKMTNNNDGTYTITDANISQNGKEYGWFSITSVESNDWDLINSNRFGPVTDNEDPTLMVSSEVTKKANSWQVPNGIYDIIFDTKKMTLTVKIKGTQELKPEIVEYIEGTKGNIENNKITISVPKDSNSKYAYINITAPDGTTAVYYQVLKGSSVNLYAIDGYVNADYQDEKYLIPLEIGTHGSLNLYYTTNSLQTVPVSYSYDVSDYVVEDSGNQEPGDSDNQDPEKPGGNNPDDNQPGDGEDNNDPGDKDDQEEELPGGGENDKPVTPDDDNENDNDSGNGTIQPDPSDPDNSGSDNNDPDNPDSDIEPDEPGDDVNTPDNDPDDDNQNTENPEGTGIEAIENDYSNLDYWFDLRGNRINKPSAPGIYIHNGKKILIRK